MSSDLLSLHTAKRRKIFFTPRVFTKNKSGDGKIEAYMDEMKIMFEAVVRKPLVDKDGFVVGLKLKRTCLWDQLVSTALSPLL